MQSAQLSRSHDVRALVDELEPLTRSVDKPIVVEEIEIDDWYTRCRAGSLASADPPEDVRMATDREDAEDFGVMPSTMDEIRGLRADALQDLDLFD